MRIPEHGKPRRRQAERLRDRVRQHLRRLVRQAIHQIEVQRRDCALAKPIADLRDGLDRLNPVDRRLHARVELLNPEAGAVAAHRGQRIGGRLVERARVDLHGDFGVFGNVEALADRRIDAGEIGGRKRCRGAAAPMDVAERMARAECIRAHVDLCDQPLDIGRNRGIAGHQTHVAAAIPAHPRAERHVQIERHRLVRRQRRKPGSNTFCANLGREMRRGRIARVARHARAQMLADALDHVFPPADIANSQQKLTLRRFDLDQVFVIATSAVRANPGFPGPRSLDVSWARGGLIRLARSREKLIR